MREMSGRASGLTLAIPSRLHGVSKLQALYQVRKLERPGAFLHLLVHLMRWLGSDAPRSVLDSLLMYLAKEAEKAGRAAWPGAPAARAIESLLSAPLSVARMHRYAARVLGAERGVRFIPVPHGGIAIDVDFSEELSTAGPALAGAGGNRREAGRGNSGGRAEHASTGCSAPHAESSGAAADPCERRIVR